MLVSFEFENIYLYYFKKTMKIMIKKLSHLITENLSFLFLPVRKQVLTW